MSQNTLTSLSILAAGGLIWFAIVSGNHSKDVAPPTAEAVVQSVRIENGVQIIHVLARGGYNPKQVTAKGGIPTKLEVETKGTYDCSSAFTIPSMGYKKMLPPTGITSIDLPSQPAGSSLLALCGMGMYSLGIQFN